MNWVLGSGMMTNPVVLLSAKAVVNGPATSLGTSWNGMPPMSNSARFLAGISSSQGRTSLAIPLPTWSGVILRSSNQARASGSAMMSSSRLSSWSTSTPRSSILATKSK